MFANSILLQFRYADRINILLIIVGMCFCVLNALCITARVVLFGRLISTFVTESFSDSNHQEQQSLFSNDTSGNGCPWDIELNSSNYAHLHKWVGVDDDAHISFIIFRLCNASASIISSSPLASPLTTFRTKIMNKVHWLWSE